MSTHHAYHADGGGNITAMVDSSQAISASYRYDSFGNTVSSSGSMVGNKFYRFSVSVNHSFQLPTNLGG